MSASAQEELAIRLQKKMNAEGYCFHQAVVAKAQTLHKDDRKSPWHVVMTEFPVQAQGNDTRIDIVLQLEHSESSVWLICECKRANPALHDWCFVKAPYPQPDKLSRWVYGDRVFRLADGQLGVTVADLFRPNGGMYHLAFEVKGKEAGDPGGSGRGAIEDAVKQALRGLNGMVEFLASHPAALNGMQGVILLPVVLTTAHLWVSQADLSRADVESGTLSDEPAPVREVPWLWYHYAQSPGIKHSLPTEAASGRDDYLANVFYGEYARPVAIVHALGIEAFLTMTEILNLVDTMWSMR